MCFQPSSIAPSAAAGHPPMRSPYPFPSDILQAIRQVKVVQKIFFRCFVALGFSVILLRLHGESTHSATVGNDIRFGAAACRGFICHYTIPLNILLHAKYQFCLMCCSSEKDDPVTTMKRCIHSTLEKRRADTFLQCLSGNCSPDQTWIKLCMLKRQFPQKTPAYYIYPIFTYPIYR